ncbi:MAG: hypothetical protein H5U33_27365, partial [Pseudomonas sp.]|nr:hypothetical protein [Pseudomonas sp.]
MGEQHALVFLGQERWKRATSTNRSELAGSSRYASTRSVGLSISTPSPLSSGTSVVVAQAEQAGGAG